MLLEHRGQLTADFQQFYGLDLERMLDAGEYARCATLAANLPAESRIVHDADPRTVWGVDAYILATICDHLAYLRYELSDKKGKKPKPTQRPQARRKPALENVSRERVKSLLFDKRS